MQPQDRPTLQSITSQNKPTSISIMQSLQSIPTHHKISILFECISGLVARQTRRTRTLPSIPTRDRIMPPSTSTKDRISDLPDSILSHILSFLPTHLAVRTTILSKRWKPIWLSLTTFNMSDNYFEKYVLCSAMLAMLSRDINSPILSLRLTCTAPEVVEALILAATERGVQTIELDHLYARLDMESLSHIHSCNTLAVLKLTNVAIMTDLPQINVSSIKTLRLVDIIFKCDKHMIDFFLAFSGLEELHIDLVYIHGRMEFIPQPIINCLPNLLRANISDIELLPFFRLSRSLILNFNKMPLLDIVQLPVFHNLTQMELVFNFEQTWHVKWKWVLKILQQSPNLQHLIIHEEIENECAINETNWEDPLFVPDCLLSQLRTCLFRRWRGTKCELKFAEYIMRNSKVLSSMTIRCASSISITRKDEILHRLDYLLVLETVNLYLIDEGLI